MGWKSTLNINVEEARKALVVVAAMATKDEVMEALEGLIGDKIGGNFQDSGEPYDTDAEGLIRTCRL